MDLFDRMRQSKPGERGEAASSSSSARDARAEETIQGTVDRIVFAGSDGAFTVARLKVDGTSEPLTVVGGLLGVPVGARLRVTGRHESTPRFGPQFRITGFT